MTGPHLMMAAGFAGLLIFSGWMIAWSLIEAEREHGRREFYAGRPLIMQGEGRMTRWAQQGWMQCWSARQELRGRGLIR